MCCHKNMHLLQTSQNCVQINVFILKMTQTVLKNKNYYFFIELIWMTDELWWYAIRSEPMFVNRVFLSSTDINSPTPPLPITLLFLQVLFWNLRPTVLKAPDIEVSF
jgi:hypothetical protein